jgi:hypothetical protein
MDRIIYREIPPQEALSPFIDAYWTVTGHNTGNLPDKVLPDACVDIILNTGPAFASEIGAKIVKAAHHAFWGGYSGYFQDPDGHLWEIVYNPDLIP